MEIAWNRSDPKSPEPEFYSYHGEDEITVGCVFLGAVFTCGFTVSEWREIIEQELEATPKTPLPRYLDD